MDQPINLAAEQQRLFEKMGREFDGREYQKALRSTESLLSVVPEHADSIAMKGLTLYHLERKEEGYEFIKRAIATYPRSTIAWHSLGMCQRSDKNYAEALKAFKRAMVTDPTNLNVMRDLSSACIQMRDWEQFLDVREKLVTGKPSVRSNWIGLSCGHRMLGNTKLAAAVMDVLTTIMEAGENAVEISEVHLYRVELAIESGEAKKALDILKQHDGDIKDKITKTLLRAKAHAQLGQKADAEKRYLEVIVKGFHEADCIAAMAQLRKIALDDLLRPRHEVDKYMELIEQVLAACPKKMNTYAARHVLDCCPMAEFKERLVAFVRSYVVRMVPSLVSVLKSLYNDTERAASVGEVFLQWEQELVGGDFASSFNAEKNPCYILWVWSFLASHHRRLGDHAVAHAYIDKAINHTPTLEFLYVERAKIFQAEGKTAEAAKEADFARNLDLQDKYLNSQAARFWFRDNQIEKAEETMQMFYRTAAVKGETFVTALESQCSWYEKEVGEAFYRRGDCLSALQNLKMFELHHHHNHCELSDFHNYVFRRNTMRGWFDVIETEDSYQKNKFFLDFCPGLVRTYLKVAELGEEAVRAAHAPRPEFDYEGVTPEEVKRLTKVREDYYLQDVDLSRPLVEAERYLGYLLEHRSGAAESHVLGVELYTALAKPLLVARELLALKKLGHGGLPGLVAAFESGLYAAAAGELDSRVKAIVDEALQAAKA